MHPTLKMLFRSVWKPIFGVDDVLIGGLAAGAGAVGGGLINASSAADINAETMKYNREMRDDAMRWNETMSNTAYQRGMADMKKAGLNPMLAYMKGGASTPNAPTSAVSLENPRPGDSLGGLAKGMSTAMELGAYKKDMELKDANVRATDASALREATQSYLNTVSAQEAEARIKNLGATTKKTVVDTRLSEAQTGKTEIETLTAGANLPAVTAEAGSRAATADINKQLAPVDAVLSRVGQAIGTITNAMSMRRLFTNPDPNGLGKLSTFEKDFIEKSRNYRIIQKGKK